MDKPIKGISVDGGTEGNPGPCFYQGVDIETGEQLFYEHLGEGTNNIAEFLGAVHAIHYCKKNNLDTKIWSDSKTSAHLLNALTEVAVLKTLLLKLAFTILYIRRSKFFI